MRASCLIFGLGTAASVASAWQCEPAFKSKFCSQAVAEGPEKCLQCAFNSYDAMKGYGCNKGTIQSVCNATLAQWTAVVAPYMATTNTDCSTHNRNCNACLHDESFYTHECEFCYQDRKCYGVGGGGCSDKNGAYACTSKSDYSSCHCPANNQDDDSDDSYDCRQLDCPQPGSDTGIECEFCEQMAGYLIGKGGGAVCDTLCDACCEEIPVIGPETCKAVLDVTGGCAAITDEIEKLAGDATPCNVCSGLGMCDSCAPAPAPTIAAPWLAKYQRTNMRNMRCHNTTASE